MLNFKFSDAATLITGAVSSSSSSSNTRQSTFNDEITFQFVVPDVLELSKPVHSPLFATADDIFWQLVFGPPNDKDSEFYDLFLTAIPNTQESVSESSWQARGGLTARVYLKNHITRNDIIAREFCTDGYSIMGTWIGFKKIWKKPSYLEGGKIVVGVEFTNVPKAKEHKSVLTLPWNSAPKYLIDAWQQHLGNQNTADVKFLVDDKPIYCHIDILKARSQHFRHLFEIEPPAQQERPKEEPKELSVGDALKNKNSSQPSFELVTLEDTPVQETSGSSTTPTNRLQTIKIDDTEINYTTFYEMIRYIYTDQITFNDSTVNPLSIYEIAVKYELPDLRIHAKTEIFQTLTFENVTARLFNDGTHKYPELRKYLVKYLVDNFTAIRETGEFKRVVGSPADFPHFAELMVEIFALLGPTANAAAASNNQFKPLTDQ
ncbi:729_t:CDS:2 [Ambispora gerdemannii]|uniref:729_t:CDS:1 n=1 Tax=Ambispora gerdemannii TaxID=144530 RepID=A0A9N9AT82_9GLOM|nr:729_t:CDS:2 [Ambispora gerdemannii]